MQKMTSVDKVVTEVYPEFYFSTTCHVCKVKCKELKCCKSCKVYRYCSQQHQLVDWPRHKTICNILHKFVKRSSLEHCFSLTSDGWLFSKMKIKMLLENELNRSLTPAENQLWMFPRACAVCYETNIQELFDCPNCPAASYCSVVHQMEHYEIHKKICNLMQLQYLFYCRRMKGESNASIFRLFSHKQALDIYSHELMNINDETLCNVQLGDKLSHVLTVFNAMVVCQMLKPVSSHFHYESYNSLIVHIVGVTFEWSNFDRYVMELVVHWIQNIQKIHVVFIGPELCMSEMDNWQVCEDCVKRNIEITYEYESTMYEKYFYSDRYRIPNIVAVFNCGFHETEDSEEDPWMESLPLLVVPNAPLVITSYTDNEAIKDFNKLINIAFSSDSITIFKKCERNLFHSPLPLRDWMKPDEVYYSNHVFSIFMKKE